MFGMKVTTVHDALSVLTKALNDLNDVANLQAAKAAAADEQVSKYQVERDEATEEAAKATAIYTKLDALLS